MQQQGTSPESSGSVPCCLDQSYLRFYLTFQTMLDRLIGHFPSVMIGMQQMMRLFSQRLSQEIRIQRLYCRIFMAKAHLRNIVQEI